MFLVFPCLCFLRLLILFGGWSRHNDHDILWLTFYREQNGVPRDIAKSRRLYPRLWWKHPRQLSLQGAPGEIGLDST